MTSDLEQDRYTTILRVCLVCLPSILQPACCQELSNSNHVLFFMTSVPQITTLDRLNTHITHILVSDLSRFISCESVFLLSFLHDLSVTNNYFEHARYALPHYTLLQKLVRYLGLKVMTLELCFFCQMICTFNL